MPKPFLSLVMCLFATLSSLPAAFAEEVAEIDAITAEMIKHLSAEGKAAFLRVKPIQVAKDWLVYEEVDTAGYDMERGHAVTYTKHQPTRYDWLVTFPSRTGKSPLLVAVTNDKKSWRLSSTTLARIASRAAEEMEKAPKGASKLETPDFSGDWRLLLPAGFEHQLSLVRLDECRYRLSGGLNMSGTYEVQGDELVMVEQVHGDAIGFRWKIHSPHLFSLIAQSNKSGAHYLGATLFRPLEVPQRE